MISPHDDTLHHSSGAVAGHAATRLIDRQRSARTDPAMRDGDSGRGNPYETEPAEFEFSFDTDSDVGDAVPDADPAATVPLDDEEPEARDAGAVTLPASEAAVIPTAEATTEGDDVEFETDDEVTPEARDEPAARREDADLPIPGYRQLTVPEIIARIYEMPVEQARAVQRYEGSHRRRKTLLVKLERYLRGK